MDVIMMNERGSSHYYIKGPNVTVYFVPWGSTIVEREPDLTPKIREILRKMKAPD